MLATYVQHSAEATDLSQLRLRALAFADILASLEYGERRVINRAPRAHPYALIDETSAIYVKLAAEAAVECTAETESSD